MNPPSPDGSVPGAFGHMPRLAPHLVRRPRLTRQLDARPALTLLRAPVGFGKSTVVAEWVAGQPSGEEIVVWLRVRPDAGDATTFWSTAVELLADAGVRPPPGWRPASDDSIAVVERAVRAAGRPIVLVVDAFDNVTDEGVDDALLDLIHHTHHLRLVVCLRGHRRFPPYQYLDLDTAVLTAQDLRFTADETAQLLTTAGVRVSPAVARRLHEASDGWPEPIRAVALELRRRTTPYDGDIAETVRAVSADYLRNRLIAETSSAARVDLALLSAVPEDFTPDMIGVISDDDDAKVHVEALVRQGLLIATGGDDGVVYRWPDAARRALLDELRRRSPDRLHDLHVALGRWYADNGPVDRALQHGVEAEDWRLVVSVIERSWRDLFFGHDDVLHQTFAALPIDEIRRNPRVLAVRDPKAHVPDADLHAAVRLPGDDAELEALGRSPDAFDLLDTKYAALIAVRWRGATLIANRYAARLARLAGIARAAHPELVGALVPNIHLQVGVTQLIAGDQAAAVESLESAHRYAWQSPRTYIGSDAAGKLALAHAVAGDVPAADRWLSEYGEIAGLPHKWLAPMVRSTWLAARLLLAVDRLDLEEAAPLDQALADLTVDDECWPYLLYARSQYALATGSAYAMLDRIDRARHRYRHWLGPGTVARPLLAAAEADLHFALGRGNLASAVLDEVDDDHPLLHLGRARLALLAGDHEEAWHRSTDSGREQAAFVRHRQEMLLIRAVAAMRLGDRAAAHTAVRHVVDSVRATGSLRALTTVPRASLDDLAAGAPDIADLLASPELRKRPDTFAETVGFIELTAREQQVLEDLAAGRTLKEIADRRVVSYNTVRSQKRSLYRKLDTSSRTEALARARRWGLLRST